MLYCWLKDWYCSVQAAHTEQFQQMLTAYRYCIRQLLAVRGGEPLMKIWRQMPITILDYQSVNWLCYIVVCFTNPKFVLYTCAVNLCALHQK